ncbi:MAG: TIGR04282 family arsenosugar biosynthesis glycosyltransferase [Chitinophagaceae bacterium]|nr:TIGR04282 family arsenosugar biosynthesis glycosyltransferase [Chitinophagaceae bacterium]
MVVQLVPAAVAAGPLYEFFLMQQSSALIIFVRAPETGRVKTRLAAAIGDAAALQVYNKLLQLTYTAVLQVNADRFVFYADTMPPEDLWSKGPFIRCRQEGSDLGTRMELAFSLLFEKGYKKVVIIGSDCPALTAAAINKAFFALADFEVVIGPSADGGYYLLGKKRQYTFLFRDKPWSTEGVLPATIADLQQQSVTYTELPVLNDLDTAEDYAALRHLLDL